jgi:histidyl-tRNA synthetase
MADRINILKGFRDILPGEMLAREKIISIIKKIYESYGFVPLATPAIEPKDLVTGIGDEANKQIYLFTDRDGYEVGLIYELTASLARVMAEHRNLPRPFKRYQVQQVWRYDKPDPGRFREFIQFDIDIIGTESMIADAEIIAAMHDSLKELDLEFKIHFSSRKILNTLTKFSGIAENMANHLFRILDKLDKQGLEAIKLELGPGRIDQSGDKIDGLGLSDNQINKIEQFLNIPQSSRNEAISSLQNLFKDIASSEDGIRELEEISQFLDSMGIRDDRAAIDVSIARGLDYYTGPVYEAILTDKKATRIGSVMGGGRYDQSIGRFGGDSIPATGASIGIDRLMAALIKMGKIETRPSTADIIVTVMDRDRLDDYFKIARDLRNAGYNTELYTGNARQIKKQLKYADRQEIPIAIIAGSDEFEAKEISIKDLRKIKEQDIDIKDRKEWVEVKVGQITIPRKQMLKKLKEMLGY